jgi:hypothetical protein
LAGICCGIFALLALAGIAIVVKRFRAQPSPKVVLTVEGGGTLTVTGNDPAGILPPKWVPSYPAAQDQGDQTREETKDTIRGTYRARTMDAPEKVKDYFESTLKADGFETETTTTDTDGSEVATVTATIDGGKRKITVKAGAGKGTTNLVISYQGPK